MSGDSSHGATSRRRSPAAVPSGADEALAHFVEAFARLCARAEMAAADRPDVPKPTLESPDAEPR